MIFWSGHLFERMKVLKYTNKPLCSQKKDHIPRGPIATKIFLTKVPKWVQKQNGNPKRVPTKISSTEVPFRGQEVERTSPKRAPKPGYKLCLLWLPKSD